MLLISGFKIVDRVTEDVFNLAIRAIGLVGSGYRVKFKFKTRSVSCPNQELPFGSAQSFPC